MRILDVGGGLGFTYYQTKCALPENNHLEFIIIENQAVCEAGAEFFRDEKDSPIFLSKMEDAEGAFDIIHLGSSLHYFEDWRLLIEQICQKSLKYLLIVDLPAGKIETFVTIQNLNDSKIPVWFFNVNEVIQQVHHNGFELIYSSSFQANIFNNTQILTMNNFPQKYRLYNTCNLLFSK